jgi:hypothetical protein
VADPFVMWQLSLTNTNSRATSCLPVISSFSTHREVAAKNIYIYIVIFIFIFVFVVVDYWIRGLDDLSTSSPT